MNRRKDSERKRDGEETETQVKRQGEVLERKIEHWERETGNKMAYELLILRKEWDENVTNKIKNIVNRQKNEKQEGRKWKRT